MHVLDGNVKFGMFGVHVFMGKKKTKGNMHAIVGLGLNKFAVVGNRGCHK